MVTELLQIKMEKTSFLTQVFDSQYYFQGFKMASIDPHLLLFTPLCSLPPHPTVPDCSFCLEFFCPLCP